MRPDETSSHSVARVEAVPADPFSASAITFRSPEESMAETLAIPASPRRGGTGRTGRRVAHSSQKDGALLSRSRERLRAAPALPVNELRRARTRERVGLMSELRCECARSNCRDMLPAVAETHRGIAERFVVAPAHFEDGVVVRAADRFFVIQPHAYAFVKSQSGVQ
jgi:hypothetical protein